MLEHALSYAQTGIPVIPLHSVHDDGSCTCGRAVCHSPGKHPRTSSGLKDATTDETIIRKWWGSNQWPNANIGGVGGTFLCLDIDAKHDGFTTLKRLIEAHAPLPDTAVATTGEYEGIRGRHYWFHVPNGSAVPGTRTSVRTGIDIRCAGGYAVLPPSKHYSGVCYEWECDDLSHAVEAPDWVLELTPEFVEGESKWTPNPNFRMSRQVKGFLNGELEVEMGVQRDFLVAAARSVLTTGRDVATTAQLLWEGTDGSGGIASCDQDTDDPWTPEDIYSIVSDIYSKPPTSPLEKDFDNENFTFDDVGNSQRLIASFKRGHVFHVPEMDRWYVWDEQRECFKIVSQSWMELRWTEVTDEMQRQAGQVLNEDHAKALRTHARNSRMQPRVSAAVLGAKREAIVPKHLVDADPFIFACANGLIDLSTGELFRNRASELITQRSPVRYNPKARSRLFDDFLKRSIPDDDLRNYLQLVCGYTLTGSTDEDAFFYLYGRPGTGKSTLALMLHHVMGTYAMTADTASFMRDSNRSGGGASEDLARLTGARLVTTGEVEANERLAASLISRITGGDTLTVRVLYGRPFEYTPQFKIWFAANHLPKIASSRSGVWRRVKIIKFDQVLRKHEMDPTLRSVKIKEPEVAEAILAWMVEGAITWCELRENGSSLKEPAMVTEEVETYQKESDHVNMFIEEALDCTSNKQDRIPSRIVFEAYQEWCKIEGREHAVTQGTLSRKLADLGYKIAPAYVSATRRTERCLIGFKLKDLGRHSSGINVPPTRRRRR